MLTDSGLTLGVCEWGYCVYREEFSACHGSHTGPDPVRREPSTCARCKNFSVTDAHRPYWIDQADRYQLLLNDASLPTQTLKISRARLDEARSLLRSFGCKRQGDASCAYCPSLKPRHRDESPLNRLSTDWLRRFPL